MESPRTKLRTSLVTYETILHRIQNYTKISGSMFKEECFPGLPSDYNFGGRMSDMCGAGLIDATKSQHRGKKFYFITAKGRKRLKENKDLVQPQHTNWEKMAPEFRYQVGETKPYGPRSKKDIKPAVEITYTGAAQAAIDEVGTIVHTNDVAKKLLVETFMQFANYLSDAEPLPNVSTQVGALAEVIKETAEFRKIISSIHKLIAKGVKSDE